MSLEGIEPTWSFPVKPTDENRCSMPGSGSVEELGGTLKRCNEIRTLNVSVIPNSLMAGPLPLLEILVWF